MQKDFLIFGSPLIEEEEIEEVVDTLRSGWLGTGPKVQQFENEFKAYKNSQYAVALNSCTAAIHLSILAAGIGPCDEVITTPMTFCSTVNTIIHSGATPVLADCDKTTQCIDPQSIRSKITPRTKAILPVHFAGNACDMSAIMGIAKEFQLKVIEDCAHAIETTYKGQHVGTFGDFGCFSFYVTKNLVTGEGGMVVAKHKKDSDRIKVLALHGMSADAWKRFSDEGYKHYQVIYPGYKYNMMDLQAALGIHQLKRIDKYWIRRQKVWNMYNKKLKDLPVFLPAPVEPNTRHAYHLYTLLLDIDRLKIDRDVFLDKMTKYNIGVGVHFIPIHHHPYYQKRFNYKKGDFPNSD